MQAERIFTAAKNSQPDQSQINRWEDDIKRGLSHHERPKTALTGWDGQELDFDDVQWAPGYSEPGYSDPDKAVLFANWNHVSQRVQDLLEKAGYSLEWSDEWDRCSDCGKAIRTSPDSYSWQRSYWETDCGDTVCIECIDPSEYLESLHDQTSRCSTIYNINPADHGYIQLKDGFQNGFHPGQNDNPKTIYKSLRESGENRPLIFVLDSAGQFDIEFSVWAKSDIEEDGPYLPGDRS